MTEQYDAIIIGGGHNGLVAAATLAQAGRRVLVLEQRPVLGGAAATEEVFPGFRMDTGAHDAALFHDEIASKLFLKMQGLEFRESNALLFAPQPDGRALTFWADDARTVQELARFNSHDAEQYPAFRRQVEAMAAQLRGITLLTLPDLNERNLGDLLPWGGLGLQVKRGGNAEMMEFLRVLPMGVQAYLNEWFEDEAIKGALGASGITGLTLGPRGAGTNFMFMYQNMQGFLRHRTVLGGIGSLSEALARVAREGGATIQTDASVSEILLDEEDMQPRAIGVRLASGEEVRAAVVLSNADPRRTLFGLAGPQSLAPTEMRHVRNIIYRGSTAKLNLALDSLPTFNGQTSAEQLGGRIRISPSLDYLERAYDAAKYGHYSTSPYLEMTIPTIQDATLAPAGNHILSITAQFAPYHLRESNWAAEEEAFADVVLDTLSQYAPDVRQHILHCQVITPKAWEETYGLTEGSIYHGHMGLDQLVIMRPIPGWSRYETPIKNLYLCGAGTHPGGGVTGAPGYNAARAVLKAGI